MLQDGVAVGHAGEVVADGAKPAGAAGALLGGSADFAGMFQVIAEQVAQHDARPVVRLEDFGVGIEIVQEVGANSRFNRRRRGLCSTRGRGWRRTSSAVLDAGGENGGFAGLHHVAHLAVNEAADDEVAAGFVGQTGCSALDGAGGLGK